MDQRQTVEQLLALLFQPLQAGLCALDVLLDQGLLLLVADVEVGGADVEGVDVDGGLPGKNGLRVVQSWLIGSIRWCRIRRTLIRVAEKR